jgi:RluA family pseudouridine synthase
MGKEGIKLLYEDNHILVVNKPSGIPVIPERGATPRPSVQEILQEEKGKLFIVHRIDKDTSGIIVMARSAESHKHLSAQFEAHTVGKEYLAIVQGSPLEESAQIDIPLMPHPSKNIMLVDLAGKPCTTLFKIEETFHRHTLLRVKILTGRRHQIRVHMAYMGNPLLIDPVYGNHAAFFLSQVKKKYKNNAEERPLMSRLTLHSELLEFIHPQTAETVSFRAALPNDMEVVLKQLRKWDK